MKPIECQSFFVLLAQLVTLKAEVLQAAAEDGDWERPMSRLSLFYRTILKELVSSRVTCLLGSPWIFLIFKVYGWTY